MTQWSIITPSYKQLDWLRCCIASVQDQARDNVIIEHIIQDGGTPGFDRFAESLGANPTQKQEWLLSKDNYRLHLISEPDQGMYDAINRGFDRARGDVVAHLNCDEQYLEGALARVSRVFEEEPATLMVISGALILNPKGELISARRGLRPWVPHIATDHLASFTAATFYRRSLLNKRWRYFDTRFRACADALWMMERLREGVRPKVLEGFTTAFVETGENLVLMPASLEEARFIYHQASPWARATRLAWIWAHRLRKLVRGEYFPKKLDYAVYLLDGESLKQKLFSGIRTRAIWWGRLKYSRKKY